MSLDYIRDHFLAIVCWSVASIASAYFLRGLLSTWDAVLYVEVLFALAFWVPFVIDMLRRRAWHANLLRTIDRLDKKYLLDGVLEEDSFLEARWLVDTLETTAASMNDEISASERARREYREYLELWIHEIKTPIAAARLTAQNHPSPEMRSIGRDLSRIEGYVMQALYYARSSSVEKDYIVERVTLDEMVSAALRRNAALLIPAGFSIDKPDLPEVAYTDSKWVGFILDQVIANSVKYRRGDAGVLHFTAFETNGALELRILDEGIGVDPRDLPRIFDKGFTGGTGRTHTRATGMGLYISRELASKMGLSMRAEHGAGGGLLIAIRFPRGDMHTFAERARQASGEPGDATEFPA